MYSKLLADILFVAVAAELILPAGARPLSRRISGISVKASTTARRRLILLRGCWTDIACGSATFVETNLQHFRQSVHHGLKGKVAETIQLLSQYGYG